MKIQVPTLSGGIIEFENKWKYIDWLWKKEEEKFKKFHLGMGRKEFYHSSVWILSGQNEPQIYTEYELMEQKTPNEKTRKAMQDARNGKTERITLTDLNT